jgi:hypothetical protein
MLDLSPQRALDATMDDGLMAQVRCAKALCPVEGDERLAAQRHVIRHEARIAENLEPVVPGGPPAFRRA